MHTPCHVEPRAIAPRGRSTQWSAGDLARGLHGSILAMGVGKQLL